MCKQIQEDLPQEKADNQQDPDKKGRPQGHHRRLQRAVRHQPQHWRVRPVLSGRAKAHQGPAIPQCRLPGRQKIDITIVVDMLLTGFDSKYLNTLYVDKNLKHHGLIQAFSRTNRVLNDTKPYGNILDFRQQQDATWTPPSACSPARRGRAGPRNLAGGQGPGGHRKAGRRRHPAGRLHAKPRACPTRPKPSTTSKAMQPRQFIKNFKEVQRLKTQLDQYTDLTADNKAAIEHILPAEQLQGFRGAYLETAQRLKAASRRGPAMAKTATGRCRPARFRVCAVRQRRDRLRLHHGPDGPLLQPGCRAPNRR
jgi:type I restriction enzyme R subunit